jgi:dGTPase
LRGDDAGHDADHCARQVAGHGLSDHVAEGVADGLSERARRWASTMVGHPLSGGVVLPHEGTPPPAGGGPIWAREDREELEDSILAEGATRAVGAGRRAREEEPDALRTCFERDRDRILHSTAFRRLAGKTQVFVFPEDHQRTRLTHALEVAQIATAVSRACRLNVALAEAIALGHDCGHGPGGHASEDAFGPYLDEGYDHAVWGANVVLAQRNLCAETLDGIRNHSWSRPVPSTPEGVACSLSDRAGYCSHDLEDAAAAGIVSLDDLPSLVVERCGRTRSEQLGAFIGDVVATTTRTGVVSMSSDMAEALAALRAFNYERIYMRPESMAQARIVIDMLRALTDHYISRPAAIDDRHPPGSPGAVRAAVAYVAGMTDSFACRQAMLHLGWSPDRLPRGFDVVGSCH